MTVQQISVLNKDDHLRHLLMRGACIGERTAEEKQVLLFQLHKCYVEVFFTPDGDTIEGSRRFRHPNGLEPYLKAS
jgi:hypothetical protein